MKKFGIALIVLLIAIFVGAPYVTGKVAETETLKLIAQMNQSSSEYGRTEVVSYDRAYKSTNAQYRYTAPASLAAFFPELKQVEYTCDSKHGVTGIDFQCNLEGESTYSKFVAENLDGKDPLSVFGSVSVFGAITQNIAIDEVAELDIDGQKFNVPAAKLSVTTDASMQAFDINGSSNGFSIDADGQRLSVGEMNMGGNLRQIEDQLFSGDFEISLDQLATSGAEGESSYKNISVKTATSQSGENMNSTADFTIEEIKIPSEIVSTVEDVVFSVDVKGIDTQAMLDYQALATKIQRDTIAALENEQQPSAAAQDMLAMMPIVERMLKKGLDLKGEFKAQLDGKLNRLNVSLNLLESITLTQLGLLMTQADQVIDKMNVSVSSSLSKELLDGQPAIAGMVSQSPLIAVSGDNYSVDLNLGKKIELNGKEMSFEDLQMLVFSSLPTQ